jgi:hypothetical protein
MNKEPHLNPAQRLIVEILGGDPDKAPEPLADKPDEGEWEYRDENYWKQYHDVPMGNSNYGFGGEPLPQAGWYPKHPESGQPIPGDPKSYPWELGIADPLPEEPQA